MTRERARATRPDPLTSEQRKRNMASIRGKHTKPELALRQALHARGLRYRLHVRDLPGRPDLVFPSRRAVVFVHGCFWHGHDCALFKLPRSNAEFWEAKIGRNQNVDQRSLEALTAEGWRVLTVWECALRGADRLEKGALIDEVERWLDSESPRLEISSGYLSLREPGDCS